MLRRKSVVSLIVFVAAICLVVGAVATAAEGLVFLPQDQEQWKYLLQGYRQGVIDEHVLRNFIADRVHSVQYGYVERVFPPQRAWEYQIQEIAYRMGNITHQQFRNFIASYVVLNDSNASGYRLVRAIPRNIVVGDQYFSYEYEVDGQIRQAYVTILWGDDREPGRGEISGSQFLPTSCEPVQRTLDFIDADGMRITGVVELNSVLRMVVTLGTSTGGCGW